MLLFVSRFFPLIFFLLTPIVHCERGESKGCFVHDIDNRKMSKSNSAVSTYSVDKCIDACLRVYHMFAALQEAKYCFCGSIYNTLGLSNNCTMSCEANRTQICGGVESDSVYSTGLMTPSPPQNLINTSATETSIQLRWMQPENPNGGVVSYNVTAQILQTFDSERKTLPPRFWIFPNTTFKQSINELVPGTLYNVSVRAVSDYGESPAIYSNFWTEIAEPPIPPPPEIVKKDSTQTITVQLPIIQLKTGPTTAYHVVAYEDGDRVEPVNQLKLSNVTEAKRNKIPYYMAAELSPAEATRPFTVGDGGTYNGYLNAPLPDDKTYTVVVGIVSTLNGITRASYSKPAVLHAFFGSDMKAINVELTTRNDFPFYMENDAAEESAHKALVIGLSVAIGIGGFLLLAAIIVFILMRRFVKRGNQSTDHQELTLHQTSEPSENVGIASSVLSVHEELDMTESFETLKTRVWTIPRPHLEINDHSLGEGKFGLLHDGIAHRDSQQVPVLIHSCPAYNTLSETKRRTLLCELDAMVQMGVHTNAVAIIGISEESSQLHVAMEQHQSVLKDVLLQSRALDYYPVYAEKHSKFSTFKEEQLLEFALGVAQGMAHLAQNKIIHGRLCSWHVKIVEGTIPKVSHFGLAQFEDRSEKIDYSRWSSLESLRGKYSTKSDVWSFGILLWEIITLGATPYANVRSKDVNLRVTRGMRLTQLNYLGDDLYQLMLQCWQIDLDERPSFSEVVSQLRLFLTNNFTNMEHLRLDLYPKFQYEKYELELEKTFIRSSVQI